MDTIFITNDLWRAQVAEQGGVDRVLVDLETIGKVERQRNHDTLISRHDLSDVRLLRGVLKRALLMVRLNPMQDSTWHEVQTCIEAGADILMLPMVSHPAEVKQLVEMVGGRSKTCLLLETGGALARLDDIVGVEGVNEVHIGLNDLHLALKLDFMFEILSGGLIEYMARIIRSRGLKFGIGGVARLGQGLVSPEIILGEHIRLGSSQVILSRDYNRIFDECSADQFIPLFRHEIEKLQGCVERMKGLEEQVQTANSRKLKYAVDEIVGMKAAARKQPTAEIKVQV